MPKARLIVGLIAVALAGAALAAFLMPRKLEVDIATARQGTFERTVTEEGKTRVRDRFVVSAPVAGRLVRPNIKVGDSVEAGQVLLMLMPQDPALIDRRTRTALRARALAAQASLARAQAESRRADTAVTLARSEADRAYDLANRGFVSEAARENAQWTLREHEQAQLASQHAENVAAYELRAAVAALEAAGATTLGKDEDVWAITSPVKGKVLRIIQESELTVLAGSPLIELGDTRALEVVVDVLSSEAGAIQPGQLARLAYSSGEQPAEGRVRSIEPVARTRVSALGIDEQRVAVLIDLPESLPAAPGDGWRVEASIVVESRTQALMIPVGSLMRDSTGWKVFIVDHDRARLRRVELAGRNSREAWVRDGLSSTDAVVVHPADELRDGGTVRGRRGSAAR
jgi:HlyD family secretion protein